MRLNRYARSVTTVRRDEGGWNHICSDRNRAEQIVERKAVIAELKWEPKIVTPVVIAVAVKDSIATRDAAEKAAKRSMA